MWVESLRDAEEGLLSARNCSCVATLTTVARTIRSDVDSPLAAIIVNSRSESMGQTYLQSARSVLTREEGEGRQVKQQRRRGPLSLSHSRARTQDQSIGLGYTSPRLKVSSSRRPTATVDRQGVGGVSKDAFAVLLSARNCSCVATLTTAARTIRIDMDSPLIHGHYSQLLERVNGANLPTERPFCSDTRRGRMPVS